jgi:hypothetical protein
MANYDVLLPEVLPEAPGCSEPLAVREIRNATIELCKKALIVKVPVTAQNVVANSAYVTVAVPTGTELIHLREVTIDGQDVVGRSVDALDLNWRDDQARQIVFKDYHYRGFNPSPDGWAIYETDQRPSNFHLEQSDDGVRIRLVGIPKQSYSTLAYKMVLQPSRAAVSFYTWVLDGYFETIAAGAVARLLAMPNQKWTDMATASVYRTRFNDGVGDAMGEGARDFVRDDESTGRTTSYI